MRPPQPAVLLQQASDAAGRWLFWSCRATVIVSATTAKRHEVDVQVPPATSQNLHLTYKENECNTCGLGLVVARNDY